MSAKRWPLLVALGLAGLASFGCSAILGLEARPVVDEDGGAPREDGSVSADAPGNDAGIESGVPNIRCLGRDLPAWYCDDFEAAEVDSKWEQIRSADGGTATVSLSPLYNVSASGTRSLASGFDLIPGEGAARVRMPHPGSGPLALQFYFYPKDDPWLASEVVPIVDITTDTALRATVSFRPDGGTADGTLVVTVGDGPPTDIAAVTTNQWACFNVIVTGTQVQFARDNQLAGFKDLLGQPTAVELGMVWTHGANPSANRFLYFDDVIVSPARIACR